MKISIQAVMDESGVQFGTSGARGLADAMTDRVCCAYTQGFLQYLEAIGELKSRESEIAIAGDLRPSTDRIMKAVAVAAAFMGYRPVNCGKIPSPAVALYGLANQIPAIMVTGSHIPDDRNGIKFNKCSGEILKHDEAGIRQQVVEIPPELFNNTSGFVQKASAEPNPISKQDLDTLTATRLASRMFEGAVDSQARDAYRARYLDALPADCLKGFRLGVYQHSAVGRELLVEILQALGAEVVPLGFSEIFIPVDTEAIRVEDVELARRWAAEHHFDAILSTDGDSDRPLISDETGRWLRGDVAGILCARFLNADSVSTPVSCNTAVEKCNWFKEVRRTRIGSPYVVVSMLEASSQGAKRVVGYEANGGFLINSDLSLGHATLRALPTRDALILMISLLLLARQQNKTIRELVETLPARFTFSDRLKNFPIESSQAILTRFNTGNESSDRQSIEAVFGKELSSVVSIDRTDGVRVTFENGEIVHLRPSGNAPEFRCYTEAATEVRSRDINVACMKILQQLAV